MHVQKSSLKIDTGSKMQITRAKLEESEMYGSEERGREITIHKDVPKILCGNSYTTQR